MTASTRNVNNIPKLLGLGAILLLTLVVYYYVFLFLREGKASAGIIFVVSLLWGIGGAWFLFNLVSSIVELLSEKWQRHIMPWVFAAPAIVLVIYYLLLPTIRTIYLSLFNQDSSKFIGIDNFIYAFSSPNMLESFKNNLIWIIFGGGLSVLLGLLIAALADRTHAKFEVLMKTAVFLPMAVSMIAAAVIWKLVFAFAPGVEQVGLLNALTVTFGGSPVPWLTQKPLNTYLLIVILIWMQTGFALVVFSAAIKGIPSELLEAARIDGATELQSFFNITLPYIQVTIVSVSTTIVIFTLKVFDIVFSMTGGNFGTQVIANEQYVQMFRNFDYGRGSAIAVVLLITVLPVVYYNIRDFGKNAKGF
jgi:alpha-glucoside transport system permease protein